MLIILIASKIRAESVVTAHALLKKLVRKTRREKGCISFTIATDIERPNIIRVAEIWTTAKAHEAHMKQPYVEEYLAKLKPIRVSRDVKTYEADKSA